MIVERIPLTRGAIERTLTVVIDETKKSPGHIQLAPHTHIYDTPEGAVTVSETAKYTDIQPLNPPVPVARPVIQ